MADNYLEKRMEEYRSGRLSIKNRTTAAMRSPRRADSLVLHYPPMVVLVIAREVDDIVYETVKAFTGVGCKVAFSASDTRKGNNLAQASGARFYPDTFTANEIGRDVADRWGEFPEVVVDFSTEFSLSGFATAPKVIPGHLWRDTGQASPDVLARHMLYLAHPDNVFLL